MPRRVFAVLIALGLAGCSSTSTSTNAASVTSPAGGASAASSTSVSAPATSNRVTSSKVATTAAASGSDPAGTSASRSSESGQGTGSPKPSASPMDTTRPAVGTTITTGPSQFGTILFDGRGQAIYLFDKEKTTKPECDGACASAWPPVLANGVPRASGAVRESLLGVVTRTDGSFQVTYAGHPLYFYAGEGPHEVTCHKVSEFGGLWLVLGAEGTAKA